jgi:hypothetical protein
MDNANFNSGEDQLPQHLLEAVHKLIQAGSPPETISFALGLRLEVVQQALANDPKQTARLIEAIKEKSRDYRCALSYRLMACPVMAADENYYEQSVLEAHPTLSRERVIPSSKLKAKIVEFSKETLKGLEAHLRQRSLTEEVVELTAECMSVLNLEAEMETVLKVLGAVEGEAMLMLTCKLKGLVQVEYLISLMNQLAHQCPSKALCIARLLLLEPLNESVFEEAFGIFTELLRILALSAELIDLAEEISVNLSSSQLSQMNQVISAQPREREVEDRLGRLRLREAYLWHREGDTETARAIVGVLNGLDEEVVKFYEEVGWSSDKLSELRQTLNTSLEAITQHNPDVAQTLNIFKQLFYAELQSLKSKPVNQQSLAHLKADYAAASEESIANLGAVVESLHEDMAQAEMQSRQFQIAQVIKQQSLEKQLKHIESALLSLKSDVETLQRLERRAFRPQLDQDPRVTRVDEMRQSEANLNSQRVVEGLKKDIIKGLTMPRVSREELRPTSIYSYKDGTDQLYSIDLATGKTSLHRVPSYQFKDSCCWNELPGGSLLITGGGNPAVREVVGIQVGTFAVSPLPRMITARSAHAAVYHAQYVYVLGGVESTHLSKCERYACQANRWEALHPLPTACTDLSSIVMSESLYALGGWIGTDIDLIQKLSLDRLTWEVLQLRLPVPVAFLACFKLSDTQVYLVIGKTAYSFTEFEIRPLKTLSRSIKCESGPSYYSNGTLYCSNNTGGVYSLKIGSLS